MNENFFNLKKEKQDRMLNAAMKVFSRYGYQHASTDEMVREAAISKGLWFHYFQSKLGLYSFTYEYSVRFICMKLKTVVNTTERDVFTLCKQIELAKQHALRNYPYMQRFLNSVETETVKEALLTVEEMRNQLHDTYEQIFERAYSIAANKERVEYLRKIISYVTNGIMEEQINEGSFQPDMAYEEIIRYIEFLEKM